MTLFIGLIIIGLIVAFFVKTKKEEHKNCPKELLKKAKIRAAEGDNLSAIELTKKAIDLSKDDHFVHRIAIITLATIYYYLGKKEDAFILFKHSCKFDESIESKTTAFDLPIFSDINDELKEFIESIDNYELANRIYEDCVNAKNRGSGVESNLSPSRLFLALAEGEYIRDLRAKSIEEYIERYTGHNMCDINTACRIVKSHIKARDFGNAASLFNATVPRMYNLLFQAIEPPFEFDYKERVRYYSVLLNKIEDSERAEFLNETKHWQFFYLEALRFMNTENLEKAESFIDFCIKYSPDNFVLVNAKAVLALKKEDYSKALEYYSQYIMLRKNKLDFIGYIVRGLLRLNLGYNAMGVEDLKEGLKLSGDHIAIKNMLEGLI